MKSECSNRRLAVSSSSAPGSVPCSGSGPSVRAPRAPPTATRRASPGPAGPTPAGRRADRRADGRARGTSPRPSPAAPRARHAHRLDCPARTRPKGNHPKPSSSPRSPINERLHARLDARLKSGTTQVCSQSVRRLHAVAHVRYDGRYTVLRPLARVRRVPLPRRCSGAPPAARDPSFGARRPPRDMSIVHCAS